MARAGARRLGFAVGALAAGGRAAPRARRARLSVRTRRPARPDRGRGGGQPVPEAVLACVEAIASPAYVLDRDMERARSGTRVPSGCSRAGSTGRANEPAALHLPGAVGARADPRYGDRARAASSPSFARRRHPSRRCAGPGADRGAAGHAAPVSRGSGASTACSAREGGIAHLRPPADGFLRFEQVTFDVASRPDLKLTVLLPASEG